jgi:hypothetical protein
MDHGLVKSPGMERGLMMETSVEPLCFFLLRNEIERGNLLIKGPFDSLFLSSCFFHFSGH